MIRKFINLLLPTCVLLLVGCNKNENKLLDYPEEWKWSAESLMVTPQSSTLPAGLVQPMEADAVLNNGTTVRVTRHSLLTWYSSDPSVATVNKDGLVQGQSSGDVTITAYATNPNGSRVSGTATLVINDSVAQSLIVTPKKHTLAKGMPYAYKAEALMSDGQVFDVTQLPSLVWSSTNPNVASISNDDGKKGRVQSLTAGRTEIRATAKVGKMTFSDEAVLHVNAATMDSLTVTPASHSLAVGQERQFKANAVMTDGTTYDVTEYALWLSSQPSVVVSNEVGSKGRVQGRVASVNPVTISAQFEVNQRPYVAKAQVTVTEAVVNSLSITRKQMASKLPKGLSEQFFVRALLSDGRSVDVTQHSDISWTSTDPTVVSVSNTEGAKGLVKGEREGTETLTVTGIVAGKTLTEKVEVEVGNAIVTEVEVTPNLAEIPEGMSQSFKAMATLSDGSAPMDVTHSPEVSWRSGNVNVASVSNTFGVKGWATGLSVGEADIIATHTSNGMTVDGMSKLEVTNAIVTDLQITPPAVRKAKGLTEEFTATVILSNGDTHPATKDPAISWSSMEPETVSISNHGADKGVAKAEQVGGPVKIRAVASLPGGGTKDATATMQVLAAQLDRLEVTSQRPSAAIGFETPMTARAIFSDGSSETVTDSPEVSWSSSDESVATVSTGGANGNGVVKGLSEGPVTIFAQGNVDGKPFEGKVNFLITPLEVTSLEVSSKTSGDVPIGMSRAFIATVTLSDGSTQNVTNDAALTWESSNPSTVSIVTGSSIGGNGVATGRQVGEVTIFAKGEAQGIPFEGSFDIKVVDKVMTAIQVTPSAAQKPIGITQDFTATARFSDNSTDDVTNDPLISWTSSDTQVATITSSQPLGNGVATGVKQGEVTVTARGTSPGWSPVEGTADFEVTDAIISSLTVTPATHTLAKGLTKQYKATAHLSDGVSSIDVTRDPAINWIATDSAVSVSAEGLVKGENQGKGDVVATGFTPEGTKVGGKGSLTVTEARLDKVQVTPVNASQPAGVEQQFEAWALLTDGTGDDVTNHPSVNWTSSDTNVATVTTDLSSGNGVVKGIKAGPVTITASGTLDAIDFETEVAFTVRDAVPVPNSMRVTPEAPSIAKGTEQQFEASYGLSDGTRVPVTNASQTSWVSSNTNVATISSSQSNNNGLAKGVGTGPTTIIVSGTYDGVTLEAEAELIVREAEIVTISVTSDNAGIEVGQKEAFQAEATLTDNTTIDITTDSDTSWVSTEPRFATISTSGQDKGVAMGVALGSTDIKATHSHITGKKSLTVRQALLQSLSIVGLDVKVAKSRTGYLKVVGHYSDGTSADLTKQANWVSGDTATATVESGASNGGRVTGVKEGSTTVTASMEDANGIIVTSTPSTINVCKDLAGACIDTFDARSNGTLFTNSPSKSYLNSIGEVGKDGIYTENGTDGPVGDFYQFNWNNANRLCEVYNTKLFGGRNNWRLATKDTLKRELYDRHGNMFSARGWPTSGPYWSVTPDASYYYRVYLSLDYVDSISPLTTTYASCVSEP